MVNYNEEIETTKLKGKKDIKINLKTDHKYSDKINFDKPLRPHLVHKKISNR